MSGHVLEAEAEFERLWQAYQQQGLVKHAGFGARPAVVCVDLVRAFTDPDAPGGEQLSSVVAPARTVLDAARLGGIPVVLVGSGNDVVEFDPGLGLAHTDHVVVKRHASGFFATDLLTRLIGLQVDTVLLTGAATSGSVRATAVDAVQYGFRVAVVQDAVADQERLPHLASLFDLGTKYADLVTVLEATSFLSAFA